MIQYLTTDAVKFLATVGTYAELLVYAMVFIPILLLLITTRRAYIMRIPALLGMMLMLVILSISDFDMGDFPDTKASWDASQDQSHPNWDDARYENGPYPGSHEIPFSECAQLRLADRYIDEPSDGNCYAATMIMLKAMNLSGKDCVFMTNKGWIPATENPMSRAHVNALLSSNAPY